MLSTETVVTWLAVLAVFAITVKPLGIYIVKVFTYQPTLLDKPLSGMENAIFRLMGVSRGDSMTAKQYGLAIVLTSFFWIMLAYILLQMQGVLPFNPEHLKGLNPALAFNTAASFVTNTNWQAYSGGLTMSYFSQFGVLSYLQFVTPATGIAAGIAFMRMLSGKSAGNFFVDLTLAVTRLLLPLAVIVTVILVGQGVPESLGAYLHVHTITGLVQTVPRGPIATWEAIEHLGQNGGGFTNANSANPLENPTAFSNIIETVSMGLLPVAFFYAFGAMTGRRKFAWTLIGVAGVFYLLMLLLLYFPEAAGNPIINALGLHTHVNMVGKEVRFGLGGTTIFETSSTAFTTGSVVSAHDSYLPLSSLSFFLGMFLNMIFGGSGTGLLNMLMFVIITIFLMGLMVGRTPEFLGKKIEAREVSLASLAFLIHPLLILAGTAIGVASPEGLQGILNPGPHGLSEVLYAFTSAAANNGSAFAGLNAALPFYEMMIGVAVVLGRFASMLIMLLLAESLLKKRAVPETAGTMHTDTMLFGGILFGAVIVLNALTFFPVLALGPIAEQYLMMAHHLF